MAGHGDSRERRVVRKPGLRAPGLVSDRDGRRARQAHSSTHGQSAGLLQAGRGSRGMSSPVLTDPQSCPVQNTQRGAVEGGEEGEGRRRGRGNGEQEGETWHKRLNLLVLSSRARSTLETCSQRLCTWQVPDNLKQHLEIIVNSDY